MSEEAEYDDYNSDPGKDNTVWTIWVVSVIIMFVDAVLTIGDVEKVLFWTLFVLALALQVASLVYYQRNILVINRWWIIQAFLGIFFIIALFFLGMVK